MGPARVASVWKNRQCCERDFQDIPSRRAEELGQEPPPRLVQRTIDNTRKADETVVRPGDDEVEAEDAQDEFAEHFSCAHPPKGEAPRVAAHDHACPCHGSGESCLLSCPQ